MENIIQAYGFVGLYVFEMLFAVNPGGIFCTTRTTLTLHYTKIAKPVLIF